MSQTFYVYKITNNVSKRSYVGSRICYTDPLTDKYFGSSKYLDKDIKIFGKENFRKEILEYYDKDTLLDGETNHILNHNTLYPNGYNKFLPNQRKGFSMSGHKHTEETKQKMSKSSIGKNKGKVCSLEHKRKISESMKGQNTNKKSKETKEKISKGLSGRTFSEEHKRNLSERTKETWKKRKADIQSQNEIIIIN
jgi:group I intron endonuclease